MTSRFNWAPAAYKVLNGVFCVYKPTGMVVHKALERIQRNLTDDLNALPCYEYEIPLKSSQQSVKKDKDTKSLSTIPQPQSIQDWSEHRLVLGPRYETTDFKIWFVDGISSFASGVLVLGMGPYGKFHLDAIAKAKYLRVYHVKGRFGWATDDFTPTGKILERSRYKHVTKARLDRICAAIQAAYTKQMYLFSGVDPESQEAFELASSGLIRPAVRHTSPLFYGVKCIDFQPPDFTLEIHSINEQTYLLQRLIHDLAIRLKTTAVCSGVRRLRYGHFDTDRALVRQEWRLEQIIDNMDRNEDLLSPEKLDVGMTAERADQQNPRQEIER